MRESETYRMYAKECEKLAKTIPEHGVTLLAMAKAWIACAEAAEKGRNGSIEARKT